MRGEEGRRQARLLEAERERSREEEEEEEAGGAKLKLIKDLQYKKREEENRKEEKLWTHSR